MITADGLWQDYQAHQHYRRLLRATAYTWVRLIKAQRDGHDQTQDPDERAAIDQAYTRATLLVPQLPMEFADNEQRFDRCTWRHSRVVPGPTVEGTYCEHPWAKKWTRDLVEGGVRRAITRDVAEREIVVAIADLLHARQRTVLLPHGRVRELDIESEHRHDGLAARYARVIRDGLIIDRATGRPLSVDGMQQVEAEVKTMTQRAQQVLGVEVAPC